MYITIAAEAAEIAALIAELQGRRDAKELAEGIIQSINSQSSKEINPDCSKM